MSIPIEVEIRKFRLGLLDIGVAPCDFLYFRLFPSLSAYIPPSPFSFSFSLASTETEAECWNEFCGQVNCSLSSG